MRLDGILTAALVAGILLASAQKLYAAPDPAAADAAFDAGDSARALALYDEILSASPGDINALLRSGKLLSWDRKYDDALARYDRALVREPGNTSVLLERAKVLLWSQRYDEAVRAFDRVLEAAPKEPWALCGKAQAYAWRGRGKEARPFYDRALAAEPGMKEAQLGLAYLDLEDGDTGGALTRVNALTARFPNDTEVAELRKQALRARAPSVQVGVERADDSDDNSMNTYRAEGGLALPARLDLKLGYAHSDFHGPTPASADANGSADTLYGTLGWRPRRGQRGELRVGMMRLTDSAKAERTVGTGGISYAFPMAGWTGRAAISHEPFLYSPLILDNAIDITSLTFGASGTASPRARIETNVGYGDFSDGNARLSADLGGWYVARSARRSLLAGAVVRYLDYAEDNDNGYFDPSDLVAGLASVRSFGSIGDSAWEYEVAVEAGAQSYTFDGAKTSGKALWNLYGLAVRPLPHGLSLQMFAGFGNSSNASGPGFTSRFGGVRLRYTIGG